MYQNYIDLSENKTGNTFTAANTLRKEGGIVKTSELPLVPIPPTFEWFQITRSRIEFYYKERIVVNHRFPVYQDASRSIFIPQVDYYGSLFVNEMLPISFTIACIDYDSSRSGMLSGRSNTESGSVGWSFDITKLFSGKSGGEVSIEYQKQLSAASTYWLGQHENKAKLITKQRSVNDKYQYDIMNIFYQDKGVNKKIGERLAASFIRDFNRKIWKAISKYIDVQQTMNDGR